MLKVKRKQVGLLQLPPSHTYTHLHTRERITGHVVSPSINTERFQNPRISPRLHFPSREVVQNPEHKNTLAHILLLIDLFPERVNARAPSCTVNTAFPLALGVCRALCDSLTASETWPPLIHSSYRR